MMKKFDQEARSRAGSAAIVALLHLLIGYAFLTGLGIEIPIPDRDRLKLLRLGRDPLPPPARPATPAEEKARRAAPRHAEGAASPANLADSPTELVAPTPEIRLPVPAILPTAPVAGAGDAPAAGAADRPGPGTGSGGKGDGLGSGASGSGTGGGGGGLESGLRWLSGEIVEPDYPRRAYRAGIGGTVWLRFLVAPSGRVSECAVTRSSGNTELDSTTCRLILKRFRYRPARDAQGKAIAATVTGRHVWEVSPEPPPIEIEADVPDP